MLINNNPRFLKGCERYELCCICVVAKACYPLSSLVFWCCTARQNVFPWLGQLAVTTFVVVAFMFASLLLFLFERVEHISSGTEQQKSCFIERSEMKI